MIVKQTTLTVTENTRLADGIYRLRLAGDTSAITAPGQFVNLKLSGFFLRRPISVCDWENGELTLIYKVLGHGTEAMTGMAPGTELDVLTGLGNGYDVSRSGEHPLLVGLSAVVKVDTSDTSGRLLAASARTEPVPGDLVSQAPAVDFAPVEATISGIIRDNALPGVCPVQGKP